MSAGFNFNNITLQSSADITKVMENFNKIETNGITDAKATRLATQSQDGWMSAADKTKLDSAEVSTNKSTTVDSASTDSTYPSSKAVYDAIGVKDIGDLYLVDGTDTVLPRGLYYITSLYVNGTSIQQFTDSIIEKNTISGKSTITLVASRSAWQDNALYLEESYVYNNSAWSKQNTRAKVTASTTDLTAGSSQLDSGSVYMVYE